ncbi:rhodanese-like domain-containing protein [Sulfurimonas sp.]|uniref:rhodanese-like domain-containing protein n=1 Tax=Sulfurimonas sp. TaxID=2022749 RepID=UPI0025FF30A7|nr:rhodanese-like domain-containing protein [Sulfurimonas sp.]MDD5157400.1 rhodanese-like domain-containing protein [Sulfurimonas sp.]
MKYFLTVTIALLFLNTFATASEEVSTPDVSPFNTRLAAAEDIQVIQKSGGIVYDVRDNYSDYYFGGHIPGAQFLPFTERSRPSIDYHIEDDSFDWSALPKDKNTPIVFYCEGENCWKSYKASEVAAQIGYVSVYWFQDGQSGWIKKGFPIEGHSCMYEATAKLFSSTNNPTTWLLEPEQLRVWIEKGEKIKIIDLRVAANFQKGHIRGAVFIPMTQLFSRDKIQLMPKLTDGATIVLVSENGQFAMAGAMGVANLGYKVRVLNGGMGAWNQKEGKTLIEPAILQNKEQKKAGWVEKIFKSKPKK